GERFIEFLNLIVFSACVGALNGERAVVYVRSGCNSGGRGMAHSIRRVVFGFMLLQGTHTLHGEQRVLGAAVALFANAALLAPEVAVDGIALRHFVVAEALLEAHPAAIAEFTEQAQHLPLNIGGGLLGGVAE